MQLLLLSVAHWLSSFCFMWLLKVLLVTYVFPELQVKMSLYASYWVIPGSTIHTHYQVDLTPPFILITLPSSNSYCAKMCVSFVAPGKFEVIFIMKAKKAKVIRSKSWNPWTAAPQFEPSLFWLQDPLLNYYALLLPLDLRICQRKSG